jgi:hypothetical protein
MFDTNAPAAVLLIRLMAGEMFQQSRSDWAMPLGSLFPLVVGAGAWSRDARMRPPARQSRSASGRRAREKRQ